MLEMRKLDGGEGGKWLQGKGTGQGEADNEKRWGRNGVRDSIGPKQACIEHH